MISDGSGAWESRGIVTRGVLHTNNFKSHTLGVEILSAEEGTLCTTRGGILSSFKAAMDLATRLPNFAG